MTYLIDLNKTKKKKLVFNTPGEYIVFFHNLSGSFVFEITESRINLDIFGLYMGKTNDLFTVETIQRHTAPSSTSNLFIKGVFEDSSKFYYRGLIRLEKKAQKSHAYQKNQNLILSENVFVESKPDLEILANDVYCTHGSTTGKLNKDDVYYIQTRGLRQKQAEQLLVKGFLNEIVLKVQEKVPSFIYA